MVARLVFEKHYVNESSVQERKNPEPLPSRLQKFVTELKSAPIAQHTAEANVQHYEVCS